jgi:hypothetical protein
VNNYICACENKFDKEITCSLVGNSLNFNNTQKCKRCSYVNYDSPASGWVNATLRLFPVDCDFPDINITNYVCQKGY